MIQNINEARRVSHWYVTKWMCVHSHIPQAAVDIDRTFYQPPPHGYGQAFSLFIVMCDDLSTALSIASQRKVRLSGEWRLEHQQKLIKVFIALVAQQIMAGPKHITNATPPLWTTKPCPGDP